MSTLLPAERATDAVVPITVAPVPEISVALWKMLVKPTPVEALPMFKIVSEREEIPIDVKLGMMLSTIVRSGKDGLEIDAELVQTKVDEIPFEVTITEAVLVPAVEYILLTL